MYASLRDSWLYGLLHDLRYSVSLLIFSTYDLPDALRRNVEIDSDVSECFAFFEALFDQYISVSDRDHVGKRVE